MQQSKSGPVFTLLHLAAPTTASHLQSGADITLQQDVMIPSFVHAGAQSQVHSSNSPVTLPVIPHVSVVCRYRSINITAGLIARCQSMELTCES